uniref:DUF834 domain-containing protein n=1 Tax=Oryza rufipogon TaxID=4529 RepID=A0A0E0PYD3_ORYRU
MPPTCRIWRRAERWMHPDEEERGHRPLVGEGTAPVREEGGGTVMLVGRGEKEQRRRWEEAVVPPWER